MLANLRIGTRLNLGFGLVLLIAVAIGSVALFNASRFLDRVSELRDNTQGATYLADADSALWRLRWDVAQFIAVPDAEERRRIVENGPVQQKIVEENLARFEAIGHTSEETAALKELREGFNQYMAARPKWFELYASGQLEEAAAWRAKTITAFGAATVKAFGKLIAAERTASEAATARAAENAARARNVLLTLLVSCLLCGAAIALAIARSITGPLDRAVGAAREVASGNLLVQIEARGRDETSRLLHALQEMRGRLQEAVGTIRGSAESVGTASQQIAAGTSEMSTRIEQQAASLEETASSMEELTTAVKQNADNAGRANDLAVGASQVAARGGSAMAEVITTMGDISQSSRKIADIIGVIDSIAFQTNILALNAAVEAARAGEPGRGFAVVASEVRSLAQRCSGAAKEIRQLIEESANRVDGGTKLVESAGRTMEEIVTSVDRVKAIMADISNASREQLTGIEQVGNAVMQMDQMTQQNAALVEESASAAENMASQAQELVRAVAGFRLRDEGSVAATTLAPAVRLAGTAKAPVRKRVAAPRGREKSGGALLPAGSMARAAAAAAPEWQEF